MDPFTFIADIVESLAWPGALLVAVVLFRKPLANLVPLLRRLKYKDFEVEFDNELEAAQIEAAEALPEPTALAADASAPADRFAELARVSPRAAISEAWREVESEARVLVERHKLDLPERQLKVAVRLGDALNTAGAITKEQVGLFHRLRQLRNEAVHADEFAVDSTRAIEFASIARRLAESFRGSILHWNVNVPKDQFESAGEASEAVRAAVDGVRGAVLANESPSTYVIALPTTVATAAEVENQLDAAGIRGARVRPLRSADG